MSQEKLDAILEKIHAIAKTLERNTASLELHMKRSDLLEQKLEPVEKHVAVVNGLVKAVSVFGVIVSTATILYKFFSQS